MKRYVAIWFRYLRTDWFSRRDAKLKDMPFVLAAPDHGRMAIVATNAKAEAEGIFTGMVVADARAIYPSLEVRDDKPDLAKKLLKAIAEWSICYTPFVAVNSPDGLILDATGCAHLWGGEAQYLRFDKKARIIENGKEAEALYSLPPAALRLEVDTIDRLEKLGLCTIGDFMSIPRTALRRRFGEHILYRLDGALGRREEIIEPVQPVEPYQERLPCLEAIRTRAGIEIALQKVLESLCKRLYRERKGLRKAVFRCYRIDGKIEVVEIGTNHASQNPVHLFKLFDLKIEIGYITAGNSHYNLESG